MNDTCDGCLTLQHQNHLLISRRGRGEGLIFANLGLTPKTMLFPCYHSSSQRTQQKQETLNLSLIHHSPALLSKARVEFITTTHSLSTTTETWPWALSLDTVYLLKG